MSSFPLKAYRRKLLSSLLRGILPFWFIALAAGLLNIHQALQVLTAPVLIETAFRTAFLYLVLTALVVYLALAERLQFVLRAGAFLLVLYLIAMLGLAQSALFGDGRVILLAFIVFSGIFFDTRGGILALILSALTMLLMAILHVRGILYIPPGVEQHTRDPIAWLSGSFVLLTLGFGAWIIINLLLRHLERQRHELEKTRQHDQFMYRVLTTISTINQKIVRARHISPLLEQVAQELLTLQEYSFVWIGLVERDGMTIRPIVAVGKDEQIKERFAALLQEKALPCVRMALERGDFILVEQKDFCQMCPLLPECPQKRALVLPLIREGRKWGVLYLSHEEQPFLPEELRILEELAEDLAYALEKITAEEQTEALTHFAPQLLGIHTLDELWNSVMHNVQKILGADRVAIYTYDREKDRISCLRYSGLSEEYVEAVNRYFRDLPGSRVLRTSTPVVIQDVLAEPNLPLREEMLREGFRAYAVFPIFSTAGVVAAFVAYRNAPLPFTSHEIHTGQSITNFIAQALENLNLYERLRIQASDLGRLYAAAQDMAASLLDFTALLHILASHVLYALNATSCAILALDETQSALSILGEAWGEEAKEEERRSRIGERLSLQEFPTIVHTMKVSLPLTIHWDQGTFTPAEAQEFESYGSKSILLLPILVRGRILGLLQVRESRRRREFTQAEIRLAQALAGFGTILESAQLFQEVEKREAFFRTVIEHSAEGIGILDEQGFFRYLSPSTKRILGYSPEELEQASPFQCVHPDDQPLMEETWETLVRDADLIRQVSYRFRNVRGEWRYIEAVAHNLLHDPNVRGVVVNFRDITERIEFEQALQRYAQALSEAYDRTLEGWAKALELRDELTEDHTRRVVEMAVRFARLLGIDEAQLVHIRRGAILHDIGKMGIPDSILHKRGALTAEERRIVSRHPQLAYEMLYPIEFLRPALDIPYAHHERWDGKGYPRRLKGEEIPLAARIFSIVDVWDALTTDRPYRRAWARERALEYIRSQAGKMFDPSLVEFFIQHIDEITTLT